MTTNEMTGNEGGRGASGGLAAKLARIRGLATGRIARTASWLMVWKAVNLLSSLVVGIWLARHLGPESYGLYAYVLALVALLLPVAQFGLNGIAVKELKLEPEASGEILGTAFALRIVGAVAATAAVVAIARLSALDAPDLPLLAGVVAAAGVIGSLRVTECHFLAVEAPRAYVLGSAAVTVAFALLKIALILFGAGVTGFLIVAASETVLAGVAAIWVYWRGVGSPFAWRVRWGRMKGYVRRAAPLIISGLTAVVYLKVDLVFLSEMVSVEAAGVYAVASRISEIWYFLPTIVATAVFPRLIETRRDRPARYLEQLQSVFDLLTMVAIAIAIAVGFFASDVIRILFGEAYAEAGPILVVHVWAGVFVFQRALLSRWLIAEDLYALSLVTHGGGAIANVALNLILIPAYGGFGAAIATVISYGVASSGMLWLTPSGRPAARMMALSFIYPFRVVADAFGGRARVRQKAGT